MDWKEFNDFVAPLAVLSLFSEPHPRVHYKEESNDFYL